MYNAGTGTGLYSIAGLWPAQQYRIGLGLSGPVIADAVLLCTVTSPQNIIPSSSPDSRILPSG